MGICAKFLFNILLINSAICIATGKKPRSTEKKDDQTSNDFNTFLFDVGLHEEVKTQEFFDRRRYDWLEFACDFSTVNDSESAPCNFGTLDRKWYIFHGANNGAARDKDDTRPQYPSLGFWSEKEKSSTLYSDPIPCLRKGAANINLNLWVRGLWKFQMCFLHMKNGTVIKCGSTTSSRNLAMHKMRLEEPLPDYVYDADIGPLIVVFHAVIKNGVILLDDIEVSGSRCEYHDGIDEPPLEKINVKDLDSVDDQVKNELISPIARRTFTKYLSTILKHHRSIIEKFPVDHVCNNIPCGRNDQKCGYDGTMGTVPFTFEKRGIIDNETKTINEHSVYVAKFPSNIHGYAILTSVSLTLDEKLLSRKMIFGPNKGKFQLSFSYNKAADKRKILVCHHTSKPVSYKCKKIVKEDDTTEKDWINITLFIPHYNIQMVQIVVLQNKNFNEDETEEVMIRDIKVFNCYQNSSGTSTESLR